MTLPASHWIVFPHCLLARIHFFTWSLVLVFYCARATDLLPFQRWGWRRLCYDFIAGLSEANANILFVVLLLLLCYEVCQHCTQVHCVSVLISSNQLLARLFARELITSFSTSFTGFQCGYGICHLCASRQSLYQIRVHGPDLTIHSLPSSPSYRFFRSRSWKNRALHSYKGGLWLDSFG